MLFFKKIRRIKGRGVCDIKKWREEERLRNASTQKMNKQASNKEKLCLFNSEYRIKD